MQSGPRTPVLVGVGVVQQRAEDPREALEPLRLMGNALERAAEDAGSRRLLARADSIRIPRGFWDYSDPGRALAERFGAGAVRTSVAEIGVLQTTLLGAAARDIAEGRADVVLVAGAEARHRAQRAQRLGVEAPLTRLAPGAPDEVLRPHAEIISPLEVKVGLHTPVSQYAVIENALRFAEKQTLDAHRDAVAALQSRASAVAARNPDAWDRTPHSAEAIRGPSRGNRMLAFPYTKLHTSQWNVDQAAGLILCSLEAARAPRAPRRALRVPARGRRLEPHAAARSAARARARARLRARRAPRVRARRPVCGGARPARALQLLPGGRPRAGARARHRRGAPAHRDGRHDLRRRVRSTTSCSRRS